MGTQNEELVIVDVMGGDLGPAPAIEAAEEFARGYRGLVLVVGEGMEFEDASEKAFSANMRFKRCQGFIKQEDHPRKILDKSMANSSTRLALRIANRRRLEGKKVAVVSSANTGALALAAGHEIGREVRCPPLAGFLPSASGPLMLLDTGVNLEVKPEELVEWVEQAAEMLRRQGERRLRIGLLSVGEEAHKGTETIVQAHSLLAQEFPEEFQGNVEANRVLTNERKLDLVVADGYGGNVLLKSIEGILPAIRGLSEQTKASNSGELKGALSKPDWRDFGATFLVGLKSEIAVVKAHGRSDQEAWYKAIEAAVCRFLPFISPP